MKRCTTCQEEFADKFGFCPVDGTPLSNYANEAPPVEGTPRYETRATTSARMSDIFQEGAEETAAAVPPETSIPQEVAAPFDAFVAQSFTVASSPETTADSNEKVATAAAGAANSAATPSDNALVRRSDELRLTMLEDNGLISRLSGELAQVARNSQLTWPEFKRDPVGFLKRSAAGYGSAAWSAVSRPAVAWGLLAAFVSLGLLAGTLLFVDKNPNAAQTISKGLFWASLPAGLGVLALLAFWVRRTGKAAALSLLTAVATVGLIVGAIAILDKGQGSGATISKGWIAALSVGALALLGGLLVAWLKRERPEALGSTAGLGGRYVAESGSSGNDLIAVAAALAFVFFMGAGVYFLSGYMTRRASDKEELVLTELIETPREIPKEEEEKPKKEEPAGNNKGKGGGSKPKFEKPQGGGGGGDEKETRPVSKGEPPVMSPDPPIVLPKPQPPPERPPLLPVLPTVKGDNALSRTPRSMTFGDPDSSATDPSRGKGTGGGFGGGDGDGAGRGQGNGIGPGRGENTGGGDTRYGGGGPGGGGDGAPPKPPPPAVDRNKAYTAKEVTRKAVITSRPEPPYTEEARKNNIVGTVTVRVLLSGSGSVSQVVPLTRLPNGLTEQALAAARRIRFTPAQKEGVNVSQWVQVEYSFNLY